MGSFFVAMRCYMDDVVPVANVPLTLEKHEDNSASRAARIEKKIKHLKEEIKMSTAMIPDVNVFGSGLGNAGGMGGAIGGGLGAGLLGGVLGGALLNNGGLFGNRRDGVDGGFVTPTQLQTGLDSVTSQIQSNTIMQTLGDIKGAIPLAEGQVQLALSNAQNDINAQINSSTSNILANQTGIARDIATTTATIIASENATQDVVQNGIASVNLGIANLATSGLQNTYALNTAIRDDGDKTRALIVSQNDANLQRMLAVAEAQLAETRAATRARDVEVNVAQTVNQNNLQTQSQAQAQQQTVLLAQIAAGMNGFANQLNNVHQGIVQIGAGNAATPTTTNTNVR